MEYLFLYVGIYLLIYWLVERSLDSPFTEASKSGVAIKSAYFWLPIALIMHYLEF